MPPTAVSSRCSTRGWGGVARTAGRQPTRCRRCRARRTAPTPSRSCAASATAPDRSPPVLLAFYWYRHHYNATRTGARWLETEAVERVVAPLPVALDLH